MNILVTGATGFVGKALVSVLLNSGHTLTVLVRQTSDELPSALKQVEVGDFATSAPTLLAEALKGIDIVIHTAARVHMMRESAADPLSAFRKVNVAFTELLAEQAAAAGVGRFIFLSSIKVNGESTTGQVAFTEADPPHPEDAYGISKYEAEQRLKTLQTPSAMDIVILRLPLVYGPGVKGNFAALNHLVQKGIPLPFGAIKNQRSMLALDNLLDFICVCLAHPAAAQETFLVSDGEDVSTAALLKKLAKANQKKARLINVPVSWMTFALKIMGRQAVAERIFGSLQIDNTKSKALLNWQPVTTMQAQLGKLVERNIS